MHCSLKNSIPNFSLMCTFHFHFNFRFHFHFRFCFWALVHWLLQVVCKVHQKMREIVSIKSVSCMPPLIIQIKYNSHDSCWTCRQGSDKPYCGNHNPYWYLYIDVLVVLKGWIHIQVVQSKALLMRRKTTWSATEQDTYQCPQILPLPRAFTVPAQGSRWVSVQALSYCSPQTTPMIIPPCVTATTGHNARSKETLCGQWDRQTKIFSHSIYFDSSNHFKQR